MYGGGDVKELGYALTWKTHCFITGGCGEHGLFGHTNGDGDFVLFDSLGWPWPVHDCYARRFELDPNASFLHVRGSRNESAPGSFARRWQTITTVAADLDRHRNPFSVIGTITNVDKGFLGRTPGFRNLANTQKKSVEQTFETCRDYVVIAAGDGYEYGCFVDLTRSPVRFRDTVAVKMKAVRLLNQAVFISRSIKAFRFDD